MTNRDIQAGARLESMTIADREVAVWLDGDMWSCQVADYPVAHAPTRDEVLFWAGWWLGRRELGRVVAREVQDGKRR